MPQSALDTKPGTVLVKNVYYLMSYAFDAVDVRELRSLATEDFDDLDDLLAAILLLGIESQRKRGLEREYMAREEEGWRIKGRVNMHRTMRLQISGRNEASYEYDEYTEDTLFNQILKACALMLMGGSGVSETRRRRLRGALPYLQGVSAHVDLARVPWDRLRYHRGNRTYRLLMNICFLIANRQLLSQSSGNRQLAIFDDEQAFSALFEGFLFNFYRRHFPTLRPRSQQPIPPDPDAPSFLPTMYKDVTLSQGKRTLILDAKCYGRILSTRFEQKKLSAEHVRQIYYYASHSGSPEDVSALLVYAGTEEAPSNERWKDGGYSLGCVTLDLNRPFAEIRKTLEAIPHRWLGESLHV